MRLVLAAAALAAMSACAPTPPSAPASRPSAAALPGAEWTVFEIAGQPVVPNSKPTITFEEGRVFGSGSCNRFMGGYKVGPDGLALEMSQMASTMMACPDALMDQERAYLDVLGAVTAFELVDGVLVLKAGDGKTVRARR